MEALEKLTSAVEAGEIDYAGVIAEVYALPGPCHNASRAYKFYYVSYSLDGYKTDWSNTAEDPEHYVGADGDFRNEGMVNDMIIEIGVDNLLTLDQQAAKLLAGVA